MTPVRLQLSRAKGFNLQAVSVATNGLPAIVVSRPSRWGNPYKVSPAFVSEGVTIPAITAESAVQLFRERWQAMLKQWPSAHDDLAPLRGKNLACWCRPGQPCHADVLLEIANREAAP